MIRSQVSYLLISVSKYLSTIIHFHTLVNYKYMSSVDLFEVPEYNAEQGDNSGIDRLPGSISSRKRREVSSLHCP